MNSNTKRVMMRKTLPAIAAALYWTGAICAEEQPSGLATNGVATLRPVTVLASRLYDTAERMPAHVMVFGAGDIESSGAATLAGLLAKKAGADVRTLNGTPTQSTLAMRGFGENAFGRVKVLLDGEELNNVDMFAPNLMRVPLWSAERIEIIHGPSPVLYGDGAVAGVVSATTDTRDYARRSRLAFKAGSYGTFGANFAAKGGFENEGVLYSAAYDYLRSDGYRSHSAYDLHTVNAGVRQNFENGSTVALKANYHNAWYELPGSLTKRAWKHGPRAASSRDDWNRVWNYGFAIDSRLKLAEDQWLLLDGGFSHQHRHANWGAYRYANDYALYSAGVSPRYLSELDMFNLGSKFTAGFDFRYDRDNITDRSGYNRRHQHFDRLRAAAFLHEELRVTDELAFVAGARFEAIRNRWADYTGLADPDSTDYMGDFELAIVYRPVDGFKAYAKGTRFHRSAFADEMNYTRDGRLLDPETGTSLDIGFEWTFLDEFTLDANAYGTIMEDEIFYNPYAAPSPYGGWNGYNSNSPSKTRRIGLDTGFSWKRDKTAEASIRYSVVHADFGGGQYHGEDIPLVPNHRARVELGLWATDDIKASGGCTLASSQRLAGDFANAHEKLPGSALFDIALAYEPRWAKGWKATFSVENLFNRRYCDFAGWSDYTGGYYYPGCGRRFMFCLSYEF